MFKFYYIHVIYIINNRFSNLREKLFFILQLLILNFIKIIDKIFFLYPENKNYKYIAKTNDL